MCFASCLVDAKKLLANYKFFFFFVGCCFSKSSNYLNTVLKNWHVPTWVSFKEPGFDYIVKEPDYTLFKEP
jgi:hypothetical protein